MLPALRHSLFPVRSVPVLFAFLGAGSLPAASPIQKFGVHEIELMAPVAEGNPFDPAATVRFTPPSGTARAVTVPAFYDGDSTWRARVYVSEPGVWTWVSECPDLPALQGRRGQFTAVDSARRGRLLVHPQNPRQWITEDGRWFLNLNDTAYFLLGTHDGHGDPVPFGDFTAYVRDAVAHGITSFRSFVTSGPAPFHDAQNAGHHRWREFFADQALSRLRLDGLQETDRRLRWLHDHHPDLAVQLILFPLERWRADGAFWAGLSASQKERLLRHLVARFAAYPSILWLIVNDAHYAPVRQPPRPGEAEGTGTDIQFPRNLAFVREVGAYLERHDPWQHPRSTGPARGVPFHFEHEAWATYLHLEANYDLAARGLDTYRDTAKPVFLGEDRYEQDRPNLDPEDMRYFQRRLFWTWLLAGGSANYGGRWWVVHPYTESGRRSSPSAHRGGTPPVFSRQLVGLDSVRFIRDYFPARSLDLARFEPDAALVRDADGCSGALAPRAMRRGNEEFLAYHPHATAADRKARVIPAKSARLRLDLSAASGLFAVEWFRPHDGVATPAADVTGGQVVEFTAPWPGHDAVVWLRKR